MPGWAVSTEPYLESLSRLAQNYKVIAPDLPGFGRSQTQKTFKSYRDYADLLASFINELNLPKIHLLGHSMGGAIAIILANLLSPFHSKCSYYRQYGSSVTALYSN